MLYIDVVICYVTMVQVTCYVAHGTRFPANTELQHGLRRTGRDKGDFGCTTTALMAETGAVFGHLVNISNCSVETEPIRSLHPISSRDTRKYDQICQAKGKTKGKGFPGSSM